MARPAATKREGFRCRAFSGQLSAHSFRCYFFKMKNLSANYHVDSRRLLMINAKGLSVEHEKGIHNGRAEIPRGGFSTEIGSKRRIR